MCSAARQNFTGTTLLFRWPSRSRCHTACISQIKDLHKLIALPSPFEHSIFGPLPAPVCIWRRLFLIFRFYLSGNGGWTASSPSSSQYSASPGTSCPSWSCYSPSWKTRSISCSLLSASSIASSSSATFLTQARPSASSTVSQLTLITLVEGFHLKNELFTCVPIPGAKNLRCSMCLAFLRRYVSIWNNPFFEDCNRFSWESTYEDQIHLGNKEGSKIHYRGSESGIDRWTPTSRVFPFRHSFNSYLKQRRKN